MQPELDSYVGTNNGLIFGFTVAVIFDSLKIGIFHLAQTKLVQECFFAKEKTKSTKNVCHSAAVQAHATKESDSNWIQKTVQKVAQFKAVKGHSVAIAGSQITTRLRKISSRSNLA